MFLLTLFYNAFSLDRTTGKTHYKFILDAAIYFSQVISLLPHTNLTNLTKTASLKARSCRLCRVFTNRMASTSVSSALREIREICVKIKCL